MFISDRSSASSSTTSAPYGNQVYTSTSAEGLGANASTSARNNHNQYYQQSPQYEDLYGRQHPYAQHYSSQSEPQPNQHAPPQQSTQTAQGVRNVPIFFEGSNKPVNRSSEDVPQASAQTAATNKPRPEPLNKESFSTPPSSTSQTDQQHSGMI